MKDWIDNMSLVIAVDFDGTIAQHVFPKIGEPVFGAFAWMRKFQDAGAKLILYTMRSDGQNAGNVLSEAVEFCRKNGIEFWGINSNPEQLEWTTSPKAYAHYYIDDAAIGCPLIYPKVGKPYVDWTIVGPIVFKKIYDYNERYQNGR